MKLWTLTTENPEGQVTTGIVRSETELSELFVAALSGWVADEELDATLLPDEWETLARNTGFLTVEIMTHDLSDPDEHLRLWFTPDAIRDHFEGDEPDPTGGLSDNDLRKVGEAALTNDLLYRAFHDSLVYGLEALKEA